MHLYGFGIVSLVVALLAALFACAALRSPDPDRRIDLCAKRRLDWVYGRSWP